MKGTTVSILQRTVRVIIPAERVNMGGNLIDQPLPAREVDSIDPFLLIHHWKDVLPGSQRQQDVGVGIHPHRGFSPVTFVYSGSVHHRDSLGNDAVVGGGGTQWMFAGGGITHSERPGKELAESGGEMEFIQFWVNAPAKNKMEPAFYKPITKDETPVITKDGAAIQIVCGEYEGVRGPVSYFTPLLLMRLHVQAGASVNLEMDASHNTLLYLLDGALNVNGVEAKGKDMVWFNNDGEGIVVTANTDTRLILLSGQPIDEPIVSYGPFVMNTQSEILQAIRDSQIGKMGVLIETFE